jgi:acyl-coenzyme A synthetase/AMP-(fatty) acid ligase
VSGARLILLNSWLPKDICNVLADYAVTGISGVPAIWSEFLDGTNAEFAHPLNSVRYITISGGDLSPEQLLKLKKIIPAPGIFKTYGQTETFRSSMLKPEEYERKMTSVGRPLAGTTVYILNRAGKLAAPHERGEIIHCGDGTMMGYMGDAPGTENKLRPDPLAGGHALVARKAVFTGDTGMLDEEGYLYIIGRKDKMIKTSGYRVYPKEITDQCLGFTAVQEAVVFGVADEKIGKHIHCVIQLKPGAAATEQEIRRYLAARLPSYMVPAKIYFTDSFPRTESGKIKLPEVEKAYNA